MESLRKHQRKCQQSKTPPQNAFDRFTNSQNTVKEITGELEETFQTETQRETRMKESRTSKHSETTAKMQCTRNGTKRREGTGRREERLRQERAPQSRRQTPYYGPLGLAVRPLTHFEFVFVYRVRECSNFIPDITCNCPRKTYKWPKGT